jgi:hypothetical protein
VSLMSEADRQALYHRRVYTPEQRARITYWQSMWERSMHNPKNKTRPMPAEYYENPAEWVRKNVTSKKLAEAQDAFAAAPHNPKNSAPKEPVEMPGDLPYPVRPDNTFTPLPWAGMRGSENPPNAPCCRALPTEPQTAEGAYSATGFLSDASLSILTEAHGLVHGDRQASYGHPAVDFARTAALANVLLSHRLDTDLGPEDVAMFLVCVKLSRECHEHKRDNLVDAAGYLECRERVLRFLGGDK